MSSRPPGDSDEERGSEASSGPMMPLDDSVSVDLDLDPPTSEWLANAEAAEPAKDIDALTLEADAATPTNPKRAATLIHEVAHLRERALGQERDAAKTYAQSLTLDPTFQPNAWALRRIFLRRGFWENLVRVHDAELRFGAFGRVGDRADLHVERGRILEARLRRERDAAASYRLGIEAAPEHPTPLWALLMLGLRTGGAADVEAALGGLARRATTAQAKAALAIELARLQRGAVRPAVDPDGAGRAADTLFRALSAGAEPEPVLKELDRLSLLADRVDVRHRFLDAYESRIARQVIAAVERRRSGDDAPEPDPRAVAQVVALYREKARLLRARGAKDAALAVLERAMRAAPTHALLLLDYMDAAEDAGRADALLPLIVGDPELPRELVAEALLRQAELVARAGALGEAIGALERIPPDSAIAPLARLTKLRILARRGDAEELAAALAIEATRVAEAAPSNGAGGRVRRDAAHLFVRAAAATQRAAQDPAAGEELLRKALAIDPEYRPATVALSAVLARTGRHAELASAFEEELARAEGPRARALRQSLVTLRLDVLAQPARALEHQRALLADAADTAAHVRAVDVAGAALAPGGNDEAAAAAETSLAAVRASTESRTVAAALSLLAGRLLVRAGRPQAAERAFREALEADPGCGAAGELEQALIARGAIAERAELLDAELRAHDEAGRTSAARAVRFRLARTAAVGGDLDGALAQLEPLRRTGDRLAIAWSLDLARAAANVDAEVRLLREPAQHDPSAEEQFDSAWALAEALERVGDGDGAAAAYREAAQRRASPDPFRVVEMELGLLRAHVRAGDAGEVLASLRRLAEADPEAVDAVRAEAQLYGTAAGLPLDEEGDGPIVAWLTSVRARDAGGTIAAIAELAARAAPAAAADLHASVGIRKAVRREEGAVEALGLAASEGAGVVAVAATDLLRAGAREPALEPMRRLRADALARGDEVERRLAEVLLLESAAEAEAAGRPDDVALAYADVLALDPASVEALDGLRRLASAAGDVRAEAAALIRRASVARSPRRAAEAYAEAALLLEEAGDDEGAAALFTRVLQRMPDDDEAHDRLAAILDRRQDTAALERLLSYKLSHTADAGARVALYGQRARLRLERTGRRNDAIADFKRILNIQPENAEALRMLGRLALDDGRFRTAARLLAEALAAEPDAAASATLRLQVADAREAAGDLRGAMGVLREGIELDPRDTRPRERLVELTTRARDYATALAELEALHALADTHQTRAAVLVRIGRFHRDERRDHERARGAFRQALALDPLGDATAELPTVLRAGALATEDRTALAAVIADLRRALARDPLDVARLERLRDLAHLCDLGDLGDVAAQVLAALGVGNQRGRARDLGRPLSPATLTALISDGRPGGAGMVAEVWPLIGEAVARAEGADPARHGAGRQTRIVPGSDPRLRWVEAAAHALGLAQLAVHVVRTPDTLAALDAPEPTLVLGGVVVAGDAAARFRVGRALFLLRQRAAVLDDIDAATLDRHLAAAVGLAGGRTSGDPSLKSRTKALAKAIARRDLKTLESYRAHLESERMDADAFRAAMLRAAARFGLLVAGDAASALRALTDQGGPAALRSPEALDLVAFALDDRYANLRREAGTTER